MASGSAPNLLLLLLDSWRADFDGINRAADPLPVLPELTSIAANGTRFLAAFTAAPLCMPSRIALLTGRDFDGSGAPKQTAATAFPPLPTLYSALSRLGYWTMRSGIIPVGPKPDMLQHVMRLNATCHTPHKEFVPRISPDHKSRLQQEVRDDFTEYLQGQTICNRSAYKMYAKHVASHAGWWSMASMRPKNKNFEPLSINPEELDKQDAGTCSFPDAMQHDDFIMSRALSLLHAAPLDAPWLLDVSLVGPHAPWLRLRRGDGRLCRSPKEFGKLNQFSAQTFERCRCMPVAVEHATIAPSPPLPELAAHARARLVPESRCPCGAGRCG